MALSYSALTQGLAGERLPAAFVDLDAFDRNTERVLRVLEPGLTLRPASKSLRVVSLLERLLAHPSGRIRGAMCFSAREVSELSARGIGDLLLAYPAHQQADLELLADVAARGVKLCVVTDSEEGAQRLGEAARAKSAVLPVLLCVDMSLILLGGALHLGVRRSPLHEPAQVVALARVVAGTPGLSFQGLMAYEAQVAGLGDASPFARAQNPIKAALRRASMRELGARRMEMVEELTKAGLPPRLVNGGGSGSLAMTTQVTGVTEVTAGSAFLKSHLFDYYRDPHMNELEPAAFFALEVTRHPARGFVTCAGGGYVASGAPGEDKAPRPHLPRGLRLLPQEMAGEVQTPLQLPRGLSLPLGSPVVFRHAKAGELAERFEEYLLFQGGKLTGRTKTYRGEGWCFL